MLTSSAIYLVDVDDHRAYCGELFGPGLHVRLDDVRGLGDDGSQDTRHNAAGEMYDGWLRVTESTWNKAALQWGGVL